MLYTTFSAGGKDYKLRLSTRAIVEVEKKLNKNMLNIFTSLATNQLPLTNDLMVLLQASMQQYQHGITLDNVYDIYDAYLADGNSLPDFYEVIFDLFKVSGIIKDDAVESIDSKSEGANPNA